MWRVISNRQISDMRRQPVIKATIISGSFEPAPTRPCFHARLRVALGHVVYKIGFLLQSLTDITVFSARKYENI